MDEHTTRVLTERIRAGQVDALGEYLQQSRTRLLGLLRHLAGDHLLRVVELDDLFQEISRSAITALPKIPKEQLDVDKWLDQLARRRIVDTHRQHFGASKRAAGRNKIFSQMREGDDVSARGFEQMLIASMTSPSMAVSRNWRVARMQEAIAGLDEEQQRLLQLRYVQGLPTAQIAEEVGKSDGAVRVTLSRIVTRLQTLLANST